MQKRIFSMPVAVCGATGKQGGAVAYELLKRGHKVRALTRNPDKESALALKAAGAEMMKVDLEDRATIARAIEGIEAVYSVQDFLEAGVESELRQGINVVEEAVAAKVKYLVYSGASTMDRNTGVPHLDSKWKVEEAIRKSGLAFTIFRPAAFMENWEWERDMILKEGVIRMPMRADMTYRQVSVQDIAAMVVNAIEQPKVWENKIAALSADNLSPNEIAATFSRVLGKTVRYEALPWKECIEQQGEELTSMYRYFDDYGMDGEPDMLKRWNGSALSLENYLRENGWADS